MRLQIGGSPCTHWSIARTKNRETEPSGIGWDLFENYLIALDKFKPDYFLYENNKSMSPAIRKQITRELGVEPVLINSALVSAQSRQRLYWVGRRDPITGQWDQVHIEQPEDRGILLRDILESGVCWREKAYTIDSNYYKTLGQQGFDRQSGRRKMVAEPVGVTTDGKAYTLRASAGAHQGHGNIIRGITTDGKFSYTGVAEPIRIGTIESGAKNADFDSQQYRVYSPDGKGVTLCGQGGGVGAKTGLYAVPAGMAWRGRGDSSAFEVRSDEKSNSVTAAGHQSRLVIEAADGKTYPIYEVRDGQITIKGKRYPIKLADGFYIIRKLTVTECKRLQTVPDSYVFPVSDTQAYKMLGNGWTVDVIVHLMSHFDSITTEPLDVLSMYDGMACGHIALDKLGANIRRYRATEIDKYAIKTACHNFPDIYQLGDAFQVRNEEFWTEVIG